MTFRASARGEWLGGRTAFHASRPRGVPQGGWWPEPHVVKANLRKQPSSWGALPIKLVFLFSPVSPHHFPLRSGTSPSR